MAFPDQHEVTPSWLADALGFRGVEVEVSEKMIGTGQVGENVRYTLTWPPGVDGPTSVVGKFPSLDAASRETAAATDAYVKEIGFYRDLQHTVSIPTPAVYSLNEDLAANRFLLLMEDIAPATQGDQLVGCSIEQAQLATDAIVGLHAPHWDDPELGRLEWIAPRTPERAADMAALYGAVFPGFVQRYGATLGPEIVSLGEQLGSRLVDWASSFVTPTCLVHGDYRLDNMLFATGPGPAPLTVVDWQTAGLGHGPSDLAYCLGAGLLPADRREGERELVDRYVSALHHAGVDADPAEVESDYALGTATGYVMAVVASMIVVQTDRGDEMFCAMAERHAAQMTDWAVFDRIG